MLKINTIALFATLLFTQASYAANYMSADEVKSALTDKTLDGVFLPKNKKFSIYEAPDGTHHVLRPNGKRDKGRTWFVNDEGQHCTTHPKWKKKAKWKDGRCSHVVDAGNGEYHKFNEDGEHTHTLKNVRDGNQL